LFIIKSIPAAILTKGQIFAYVVTSFLFVPFGNDSAWCLSCLNAVAASSKALQMNLNVGARVRMAGSCWCAEKRGRTDCGCQLSLEPRCCSEMAENFISTSASFLPFVRHLPPTSPR
jgi:hypothetical protein